MRVSTLYWQYSDPRDDRQAIEPHLPVATTSADYLGGHDPALENILRPGPTIGSDLALAGRWEGRVIVFRHTFDIGVDLDRTGTAWTATIDIPELGLAATPLEEVTVSDDGIHFVLPFSDRRFAFDGRLEGQRIYPDFSYSSRSVPFVLDRE